MIYFFEICLFLVLLMTCLTTLPYSTLSFVLPVHKTRSTAKMVCYSLNTRWIHMPAAATLSTLFHFLTDFSFFTPYLCLVLISRLPSISSSSMNSCLVVSTLSNHSFLWTYCLWQEIEHLVLLFIFKVLLLSNQSSAFLSFMPPISSCGVLELSQMLAS